MSANEPRKKRVLAAMAHPDDIEFLCAGTLRLLVEKGWKLACMTLSGGDLGAPSGTRDEIRKIRMEEASRAASVLGGEYHWAGMHDLGIHYCPEQLNKTTAAVRHFSPDMVITHSPDCYMLDHEETSRLVRMACFAAGIPLYDTGDSVPTSNGVPALYYADALEGRDKFGNPVNADFWIDVGSVFYRRQAALACHKSQRDWLKAHHGVDDILTNNEEFARIAGKRCGSKMAEGFRQHRGHGYPRENILGNELAGFLRSRKTP